MRLLPTEGHPVVYGEWLHAPGRPTVLIYGHFDTQPVDPLDLWTHPPFEPVVSGGNCGSAFMIVTGGIDAADGKNNPLRGVDAAGGCASPPPAPVAATTGDFAPAGQAAA